MLKFQRFIRVDFTVHKIVYNRNENPKVNIHKNIDSAQVLKD